MHENKTMSYIPDVSLQEKEHLSKAIKNSSIKLISENIERMRKAPGRPAGMEYFDEIANIFGRREAELAGLKKAGRKIVGTTCMFVPVELILAAGAVPVRIDSGFYDATKLGDRVVPVEVCPVIRSTIGAKMINLHPYLELCDVLVSSNTCDGKTKLGEILSDSMPVWMLNVPRMKDDNQAEEYWLKQVLELKTKLENLTGATITKKNLKSAVAVTLKATSAFRRLYELRKNNPVITGRDAMLVNQALFYDDLERWASMTAKLCDELEERVKQNKWILPQDTPRIFILGCPMIWPDNWKIPNLIEEATPKALIAIDEFCSGDRSYYDPVGVDENTGSDIIEAVAERYLKPCVCPCFTSEKDNRDRLDRIMTVIKDFRISGVIYHVVRGCHLYAMEYMKIKRALDREKIPTYYLDTEYSREDAGQMKNRIDAFMEMLHARAGVDDLY